MSRLKVLCSNSILIYMHSHVMNERQTSIRCVYA